MSIARLVPMTDDSDYRRSVDAARVDCIAFRLTHGLNPDPMAITNVLKPLDVLPLTAEGFSLEQRVKCGEAIDQAVEEFGLDCVIRSIRLVAAINGRQL